MEKRRWVSPHTKAQVFEANEYVNVCVSGTLTCAIPGNNAIDVGDGNATRNATHGNGVPYTYQGHSVVADGLDHGSCGDPGLVSLSSGSGVMQGYEQRNGSIDYNRPISNVVGFSTSGGSSQFVTWNSTDGSDVYSHYGILNVVATGSDANRS